MTGVEERALLRDYLESCARLASGLERAVEQASHLMPVDPATLDDMPVAEENLILAYLKRFEQFEDALGRSIKTVGLIMSLGKVERLQPRDLAYKAEAYGIVADAETWAAAVRARNALVHEYPLRPDKRALQINNAWQSNDVLRSAWDGLNRFVERERLLHDDLG